MTAIKNVKKLQLMWETVDPFLLCGHHDDHYPKGNDQLGPDASLAGHNLGQDFFPLTDDWRMYHGHSVPGFPAHSHRGFETVTISCRGYIDHFDSSGATGRYGGGDVQWMTAGNGIQHSEMFPLLNLDKENPSELFQIWLNLPAKSKRCEPAFKMFWQESMPIYTHRDQHNQQTQVEVIAGELEDTTPISPPPNSWAADEGNHVAIWHIHMDADAEWQMPPCPAGVNRRVYYYKGKSLAVNQSKIEQGYHFDVEPQQPLSIANHSEPSHMLLLQGRSINEPVAQHGPFVMNTHAELMEAVSDYQKTQFGGWPWQSADVTHSRYQARFISVGGKEQFPPTCKKKI
jgi:redox-sensitive bicupin YhaK (pirin superfamily)